MSFVRFVVLALTLACALAPLTPSAAQPPPAPPATAGTSTTPNANPFGAVEYGRVDRATVRVFAVGDVVPRHIRGSRFTHTVGVPSVGHGTGVMVDPRGVIATAAHVIEGARHVAVRLPAGGGTFPATVVMRDDTLDFALLLVLADVPFENVVPLPEQPPTLSVRQTVDAIGYPLDPSREQPQSTRGIVSAALDDGRLQLGISVNPGNSGGPLIDERENLIGLVVARGDPTRGVQGIGLAVPVAPVRTAFDTAMSSGALARSFRALRQNTDARRHATEIVDVLVRLGGLDLLDEAAAIARRPVQPERLREIALLADRTQDPDLLVLFSALFWDATVIILEGAGGHGFVGHLPPGVPRSIALEAHRKARALAQRAHQADPQITGRAPFLQFIARVPAAPSR
ncbi:MAG: trypsin-like peptidase domain-containing protein [Myxococcota bacterium]|nr:trypsin-like peptidase domain-containing protein [Myxococcota bacterium]